MQWFWFALGVLAVVLAVIGIALPVMPTVPFLLVAAWAFARSSPELRQKILDHPTYGPSVRDWHERGAVSRVAKLWAVTAMSAGVILTWFLGLPIWLVAAQAAVCALISLYILTRPTR